MIQSSQRQRQHKVQGPPLELHQRMARREVWQRRLMLGSVGALLLSVLALVLRLPLAWHLGASLLGFVLGLLYPQGSRLAWALAWIEGEAGLGYRTALELAGKTDSYGFYGALRTQAEERAARLEPPKHQPWWLPLLALALSLSLVGAISLPGSLLGSGGNLFGPGAPTPPAQEAVTPPAEDENEETTSQEDPQTEALPEQPREASPERPFDTPDNTPSDNGGDASVEGDTLARFLRSTSEREPPPEQEDENSAEPGGGSGREGEPGGQQQNSPENVERSTDASSQQEASQRNNAEGQQNDGQAGDSASGAAQAPEEQPGEQGQEQESATTSAQTDDGTSESGEDKEQEPGGNRQLQAGDEQQSGGEGSSQQGQQAAQNAPSDKPSEAPGKGRGQQGGVSPTAAQPSGDLVGSPQGGPEFLEGQIQEGESNMGGEVRLPGIDPDNLPAGSAPASYQRALEEAITEGRIPVEYQEILRNYFR